MLFRVSFQNRGGELDYRVAVTPELAVQGALEMLEAAGALYEGDKITIEEIEE
jgi:hypothetical protein